MPDYGAELGRIDLPVHLMVGEIDRKFRRLAKSMAASLPRAEVEIVPAAGHNLILEAPGVVASAIERQVGERSVRGRTRRPGPAAAPRPS